MGGSSHFSVLHTCRLHNTSRPRSYHHIYSNKKWLSLITYFFWTSSSHCPRVRCSSWTHHLFSSPESPMFDLGIGSRPKPPANSPTSANLVSHQVCASLTNITNTTYRNQESISLKLAAGKHTDILSLTCWVPVAVPRRIGSRHYYQILHQKAVELNAVSITLPT